MIDQPAAVEQLHEALDVLVHDLAGVVGTDVVELLVPRTDAVAHRMVGTLVGEDASDAAQAAVDLTVLLWREAPPAVGWWATPLGRAVALAQAATSESPFTYQQAAQVLGVARGTISQWVDRGTLRRHPAGGVLGGSVLDLARHRAHLPPRATP